MPELNPIEECLSRIEVQIRQLKVQYDLFFSGAMPRQPYENRKDLEILIKTLGNTPMQRFSDRYRYNALASKYQTMVELWNKMIRAKEEGRLRPGIPGFVEPVRRPPADADDTQPGLRQDPLQQIVRVAPVEEEDLKLFYDKFLEASRAASASAKPVSFKQFAKQITAKTEAIRLKAGCEAVTYTIVVKENGVALKAAPVPGRERQ